MYNFRSLWNKFPTNFWSFLSHFTPYVTPAIFRRKKKPKIFVLENWMERGVRKTLNFKFVKLSIPSKIFEKTILNPLYLACKSRICGDKRRSQATCDFERTQVTLGRPNWDTNFIAPLRMPFQWSKSTVGSLRSVFIVLMRTPSFLRCLRIKNGAHLWPTRVEMTWKSQCCCLFIKKTSFFKSNFHLLLCVPVFTPDNFNVLARELYRLLHRNDYCVETFPRALFQR